jgi:hypothetical protein
VGLQCIWIGCKLDAWEHPRGERSYFCLEHAYKNMRGDLVMNEAQLAIYNREGFFDALNEAWRFPDEYLKHRRHRSMMVQPWGSNANQCWRCGKVIAAKTHRGPDGMPARIKYCGRCRIVLELPENEAEPMMHCMNKGRYLDRNCLGWFPMSSAMGPQWTEFRCCPPCWAKLANMGAQWRKDYGYDF